MPAFLPVHKAEVSEYRQTCLIETDGERRVHLIKE
jgi:hypothetical protein